MREVKRWYDHNDKVYILITHLQRSPLEKQLFVCKTIIKMCREENIHVKNVTLYVRQLRRRWYDYDETVCLAMEHLKIAPSDLQAKIASKILYNMKKIDEFLEKTILENQ